MTGDQTARENSMEDDVSFRVTMTGFDVCMGTLKIGELTTKGFRVTSHHPHWYVLTPADLHAIANKIADVFQVDWSIVDSRKG